MIGPAILMLFLKMPFELNPFFALLFIFMGLIVGAIYGVLLVVGGALVKKHILK